MEEIASVNVWMHLKVQRKIQVDIHVHYIAECMQTNMPSTFKNKMILPWKYFQQFFIIYFIR